MAAVSSRPSDGVAVVALVASAGGIDAVPHVLGCLPRGFAAAIVIHQAPDRANKLVALLGRRCALPVVAGASGAALEAGRVIVAPPGTHLLITPSCAAR
jgi:two-component system, chemotaxis family, protein-glutamate methylesterase/glutaminase